MVRMPQGPFPSGDNYVYVAERSPDEPCKEQQRIDELYDTRESDVSSSRDHLSLTHGPVELPASSSPKAEDFPKPPRVTHRRQYRTSPYPPPSTPPPVAPLPKLPSRIKSCETEDTVDQITRLNELIWLMLSDPTMKSALAEKDKFTHAALLHTVVVLLATSPGTTDNARKEALKICSIPSTRRRTELALGLATMTQN